MTMQNAFVNRQHKLLADLAELVKLRAAGEEEIDRQHAARDQEVIAGYRAQREESTATFEKEITALRGEYRKLREETIFNYESGSYAVIQESEQFDKEAAAAQEDALDRVKRRYQLARRVAVDEYEEKKDKPKRELQRVQRRCQNHRNELQQIWQTAEKTLRRRGCPVPDDLPVAEPAEDGARKDAYQTAYAVASSKLTELQRQSAAQFLERGWPFLIFLFTALGGIALWAVWPADAKWSWPIGIGVSIGTAAVIAILIRQLIRPIARKQTIAVLPALLDASSEGESALQTTLVQAEKEAKQKHQEMVERRDHAIAEAHAAWSKQRIELNELYQEKIRKAAEQFRTRRKDMQQSYQDGLKSLDEKYLPDIEQYEKKFAEDSQTLIDWRQKQLEANKADLEQAWDQVTQQWTTGYNTFQTAVDEMNSVCDGRLPAWDSVDWTVWEPSDDELPALRFGSLAFRLQTLPHGVPRHERLHVSRTEFALPAALSYPTCPSILYVADGDGREVAIRSLQDVMLRMLTSLPAGKVRYTIIDPTGLGQNFSAFMHLADFDERLVTNRIWTESLHISKRLADLTEHMENVIQKYLRNEFESIQQYNKHAGEVAEPFQVLVVANFPANFSEESARRLASIASSGARCGVYTMVSVDTKMKMPRNFELADLESNAVTLSWKDGQFHLPYDTFRDLPLSLDEPPDDERFTTIVRTIGERAKDANRVEVPFESVVPAADKWWTWDSRGEIEVPLGRAGATNMQSMRLGKGTSQHVLISGKTGSGKSTLLHAMITNLAIHYSPDEIQFYLVDFKKGVEFKAYATHQLPHARVIAIESEREFGMSVLERLDLELKRRGDRFRNCGVQDLKGFRDANPDERLPRIMLIIDEFQEFFVKDDKIAQDASLLLDRLVRQGRAFGIHVLLGSQTLAGAYSLARSTLGQMAVRIALQCSEGDAHLILSDDNTAARLLSRPGEAIYNDANGLFEGNHPFQVVWLPDDQRESYLEQLSSLAKSQQLRLEPPIIFEGNVAADPAKNDSLRVCLKGTPPATSRMAPRAWLGAAVAIRDPACAVFHRQSGSNLLMVGQQEEMALGVLANCVISLAAERKSEPADAGPSSADRGEGPRQPPRFHVLDGQRQESPSAGFWPRLAKRLPLDIAVAGAADMAGVIGEVAAEVDRRVDTGDDAADPVFLILHNLARFRDLRKSDDYSFSMDEDSSPKVEKQFSTILREGPNYGVHTLIWCDSFTNVNRWIDRQSMHDMSFRVLFQMSGGDSANLMDTPEASRLGIHRAILYNEEQGDYEKFRPYGLPSDDWLRWVNEQLQRR